MDAQTGFTCSSVNLRATPDLKTSVIEALKPQEHVQVLEDAGNMVKVLATRWTPPILGYTLKSSVFQQKPDPQIFPKIDLGNGLAIPSVPASLPLSTFLTWLDSQAESPWLPAGYLDAIKSGQRPSVGGQIRAAITNHQADWDAWVAEIKQQNRTDSAIMDEWLVILAGGREMWSFRTERLFAQPSQSSAAPAWITSQDVLHWTGHIRINNLEPKYKVWYEVQFTKLDREFKGWYKASLLEEYIIPTPDTDLTIPGNQAKVFDLSHPLLRLPADPEIDAARKAGLSGAQYINIKNATGWAKVNHNLCGEFCAAALGASDVVPFLKAWLAAYAGAKPILLNDTGTGIPDLESMLTQFNKKYEFFQSEASVIPLTPAYLRKMLDSGRMAIMGTGITYDGKLKWSSHVRHWVVIEDFIRVANSGWVRVYNPFSDREEVYPFTVVFDSVSGSSIGLWVDPTRP
jgi:hypothetical protein